MTGGSSDKRVKGGGATNLRELSSQKAREVEEAHARLERNLQVASAGICMYICIYVYLYVYVY